MFLNQTHTHTQNATSLKAKSRISHCILSAFMHLFGFKFLPFQVFYEVIIWQKILFSKLRKKNLIKKLSFPFQHFERIVNSKRNFYIIKHVFESTIINILCCYSIFGNEERNLLLNREQFL